MMPVDERLSWRDLFTLLDLTPGVTAKPTRLDSCAQILSEIEGLPHKSNADERMTLMAGLLAPFFCPAISWPDTFEIARAGESSPLMFQVFQERHQIGVVLHLCKALKRTPVLELAHEGPKRVAQMVVAMLEEEVPQEEGPQRIASNFLSYFVETSARESATQLRDHLVDSQNTAKPEVDIFSLLSALPAWSLLTREVHPRLWASRHDEIALILKNATFSGIEARQKRAVQMMEEAIETFEGQGAIQDAAISKSNLANLISRVNWLTVDERFRRATALYDSAIQMVDDGEFRALLMDNIAGRLGEAANLGFPGSRRKALEMSAAAAEKLEAIGKTERLPVVLSNMVLHLKGLREETESRKEDLEQGRDLARRALGMLNKTGGGADREAVLTLLKKTLADVLIRSTDFEPNRTEEFAAEAIELLDSIGESEESDIDSIYGRAKAQSMLGNYVEALRAADSALSASRSDDKNPEFVAELLRFRFRLLQRLRPPGDPIRIEAAEQLADYGRINELSKDRAFGEGALIEEQIYASVQAGGKSGGPQIERAEAVLAQIEPDTSEALQLQSILANAYANRAVSTLDEGGIAEAAALFEEISPKIPAIDRLVIISNVLTSWMRITAANHSSGALNETIEAIRQAGKTILAEHPKNESWPDPSVNKRIHEASEVCSTADLYMRFLEVESSVDQSERSRVAAELESWAQNLGAQSDERSNRIWTVPILLEASAHLRASLGQVVEAEAGYRRAFSAIGFPEIRASLGRQILENLYTNLCAVDSAAAFCEIARKDAAAGSWTAILEQSNSDDSSDLPSVTRDALLAFEAECLSSAERGGYLKSIGGGSVDNWEEERRNTDAALRQIGLPALDAAEFPIDTSTQLSSTAATAVLCSGRRSGYALIVPPGARVDEAVSIQLPQYSAFVAENLAMGRAEGWIPALLAWRSSRRFASFDTALRRTAVRLWDSAIGRVYEELSKLGCSGGMDLVVRGNQRLFPWGCAAPSADIRGTLAELIPLSTGFDLSTLLLGQKRADIRTPGVRARREAQPMASILMAAPFLGIPIDTAMKMAMSSDQGLRLLSITDGTGDLPMTRLEGDAARAAFAQSAIHLEGGISPLAAPFLAPLIQSAEIFHVASHGVWMPLNPWVSAVMLGPAYPLFAAAVRARLQLSGSLVVLSACESGVGGPTTAGEGGLVQAFLLAGARSVIASSWMVQDLSSLIFANAFFAVLGTGEDVFAAVKSARQSTRDMTLDELRRVVDHFAVLRPEAHQALLRSIEEAASLDTPPFASPVHWGAQFVACVSR